MKPSCRPSWQKILDEAAGDVAGAGAAEEFHGDVQNVIVQAAANVVDGVDGGAVGVMFLEITNEVAEEGDADADGENGGDGAHGAGREFLQNLPGDSPVPTDGWKIGEVDRAVRLGVDGC